MALKFPSKEANSDEILAYQREATKKFGSIRNLRVLDWEKYRLYPAGHQWLDLEGGSEDINEPFLSPDTGAGLANTPMPELNRIAPILDGEVARLVSSASSPTVKPNDRTTRVARAARLSGQVLEDIAEVENWIEVRQQDRRNAKQFGTAIIATGLENDFDDLENVPSGVYACSCGWNVKSETVEFEDDSIGFSGESAASLAKNGIGSIDSEIGDSDIKVSLKVCPDCGKEKAFSQRLATPADGDEDRFGNPLMDEIPNQRVFVRCYSVYDFFPAGNGRSKHGFIPEYTIESIVPYEWLLKRHKHAAEVEPMTTQQMTDTARWHPSGVEYGGIYGFNSWNLNEKARWCVYRITVREPFKNDEGEAEPMGRLIISANDTVLSNGDLIFEHKESKRKIHRFKVHIGSDSTENDSIYGVGLVSRLIGSQDTVNNALSMSEYNMHTFGSPRMMAPSGTTIEYIGTAGNGSAQSDVFQWTGEKPEVMQPSGQHPDAFKLIDINLQNMERAANQSDISRGIAPPGVSAASAMMYLGEKSGEAKKPTEERFAKRDSRIWRHVLELVNAVYETPRQLRAGDRGDYRTQRTYTASDLMWQLDVKVEVKPEYDNEVFKREAIKEALQAQTVPIQAEYDRYRVNKLLGVSEDTDPASEQQTKIAEDEWLDFMFGAVPVAPVVKTRYDNHEIHEKQHMKDLLNADGESLFRHWNMVQLATEGWDKQLAGLDELQMAAENPVEPTIEKNPIDGSVDPVATKMKAEAWAFGIKAQEIVASMPKNNEQRIFLIMVKLLSADPAFLTLDEESAKDAVMLIRFLSHIEAHRSEIAKAQAAMMAASIPPAPQPKATPQAIKGANPDNPPGA